MSKITKGLTLLALLVLLVIFSSGCAKGTATPTGQQPVTVPTEAVPPESVPTDTTVPNTVPEKSQIVIVISEDPPSFNPIIAATGYDSLVMELVMLGLADMDVDGNIFPELSSELPTLENGDVVIDEENGTMDVTWKLRQDIQWADGTPVTAEDVVFTYNALVDPEKGSWIQGIEYVDGVEKIDDYTAVVHYNTIYPGYLTQFGGYQVVIWPAHYCDAEQGFSTWDCASQPLSNGPYVLTEWVVGDHMTFERNPNYFEPGKPAIDRIVVRIVPDETVRKQMLINGDADLDMWTTEPIIAELQNQPNTVVSFSPYTRWVLRIFFNFAAKGTTDPVATSHPVFSDVRVRRAVQMAIDAKTISKEFFYGFANLVWTEFYRAPYNLCDIPEPVYDPEAAKALLEEAGWTDQDGDGVRECHGCITGAEEGYKMEMEFITYAEYGEALELTQQFIAEELAAIGIKLNLSVVEGSVLWALSTDGGIEPSGNFDIDIWDDGYAGSDPTDFLWSYYTSGGAAIDMGYNYGRYLNPEIDDLINQAYTLDEDLRKDLFCQIAKRLNEDLPELLLFTTVDANTHSTRLQGVQSNPNDIVTWNAADWTLK
ncbi:MAG: peptide ABC transporter substrate-binding protein [Anaerolineales bacterium]